MTVEKVVVSSYNTNCYIVTKNDKTIIIDPGDDVSKIINACKDKNIFGILVTHRHPDHIGALEEIKNYFKVSELNTLDEFDGQIIKTPGHTSDSLSFYFPNDKILFSGDFLFYRTIGRMDLPTGNIMEMKKSLENISLLPNDVVVYPGHGIATMLGEEKQLFATYF